MLDLTTGVAQIEAVKALAHELETEEELRRALRTVRAPVTYRRIMVWLASLMIAWGEQLQARYAA